VAKSVSCMPESWKTVKRSLLVFCSLTTPPAAAMVLLLQPKTPAAYEPFNELSVFHPKR
jgi:hypothetical protein